MPERPDKGPERRDVTPRGALVLGGWIAGLLVAGVLLAWGTVAVLDRAVGTAPGAREGHHRGQPLEVWPDPRLQVWPPADLYDLDEWEEERLTGWRWVDRSAGVVRIPVDVAAGILLEQGLPARPQPAPVPWPKLVGEATGGRLRHVAPPARPVPAAIRGEEPGAAREPAPGGPDGGPAPGAQRDGQGPQPQDRGPGTGREAP